MEYQVRQYRIAPEKMDEFVTLWREKVVPLRQGLGFTVHGAWVIEDADEFLWIIGYEGPEGLEAANTAYYASEARQAMTPDPADLIVEGRTVEARRVL